MSNEFSNIDFSETSVLSLSKDAEGKTVSENDDAIFQLKYNWLKEKTGRLVKMETIGDGNCFYHAVLKCTYPEYQDDRDYDVRTNLVKTLKRELGEFLFADSGVSEEEIKKILQNYYDTGIANPKDWGFKLKLKDKLFKSTGTGMEGEKKSFYLISSDAQKKLKPTSNYFLFGNGSIALQGFSERNMEKIGIETEYDSSTQPQNIYKVITGKGIYATDISITITSMILRINIVFLKPWTNAVSIENIKLNSPDYPYILLFHLGDLGGWDKHGGHYESGGIKRPNGVIQTIFYPGIDEDDEVISAVNKYLTHNQNKDIINIYSERLKAREKEKEEKKRRKRGKKESEESEDSELNFDELNFDEDEMSRLFEEPEYE